MTVKTVCKCTCGACRQDLHICCNFQCDDARRKGPQPEPLIEESAVARALLDALRDRTRFGADIPAPRFGDCEDLAAYRASELLRPPPEPLIVEAKKAAATECGLDIVDIKVGTRSQFIETEPLIEEAVAAVKLIAAA